MNLKLNFISHRVHMHRTVRVDTNSDLANALLDNINFVTDVASVEENLVW